MTPEQRRRRARLGALALHAQGKANRDTTAAARAAAARFEHQVDPDGSLAPAERERRASAARRAHMIRLSQAAADKRKSRG